MDIPAVDFGTGSSIPDQNMFLYNETAESSDTSGGEMIQMIAQNNTEINTARRQRKGRRRKKWHPVRTIDKVTQEGGRWRVISDMLTSEHHSGTYIGDPGEVDDIPETNVIIACTNVNKNFWNKMQEEYIDWIVVNKIDILICSDTGIGEKCKRILFIETHN